MRKELSRPSDEYNQKWLQYIFSEVSQALTDLPCEDTAAKILCDVALKHENEIDASEALGTHLIKLALAFGKESALEIATRVSLLTKENSPMYETVNCGIKLIQRFSDIPQPYSH